MGRKMGRLGISLGRTSRSSVLEFVLSCVDYAFPLIAGCALGWFCAGLIAYSVASKSSALVSDGAATTSATQERAQAPDGLMDFIFANPFSITPLPVAAPASVEGAEEVVVTGSLASAVLTGTFPNFGAWLEDKDNNKLVFLSIGEDFDSYKLEKVSQNKAEFRDSDGNAVTKFLYLLPGTAKENQPKPQSASRAAKPAGDIAGQVTAAEAGGKEGVVARDVVNQLLMNPFDEMKKFRLRPSFDGDESIGIEVQWIDEGSILGSLGVVQDDIIKSVNGIPIKNMGDVANAINSLMNGSRFDVEVIRGSSPTMLTYVVK